MIQIIPRQYDLTNSSESFHCDQFFSYKYACFSIACGTFFSLNQTNKKIITPKIIATNCQYIACCMSTINLLNY